MSNWLDSLFGLPGDHAFTPAVRWILVFTFVAMVTTLVNFAMLMGVAWLLYLVYGVKKQTRDLLIIIREWVDLAKGIRDQTLAQGTRVERKTEAVAQEVQKVPDRVVDRLAQGDGAHKAEGG